MYLDSKSAMSILTVTWMQLHKCILETHGRYDEDIHAQRKADNENIEIGQSFVLGKPVRNQVTFDKDL